MGAQATFAQGLPHHVRAGPHTRAEPQRAHVMKQDSAKISGCGVHCRFMWESARGPSKRQAGTLQSS